MSSRRAPRAKIRVKRKPAPKKKVRDIGALLIKFRRVSTADLAALLCARLLEQGRADLAGILTSVLSGNLPEARPIASSRRTARKEARRAG